MQIQPLKEWGIGPGDKLLIAGPCSAETRDQVMSSTQGLKASGVHMLRAGIWKPRTRPNSFEGVGKPGLGWLKEAGIKEGLPVTVEVANTQHVEEALEAGVDVLWVGARTSANPFAVQEIADAVQGMDIPMMVKNPINPDVSLWMGALERLNRAGITKIAGIHRGFSVYDPGPYRNRPQWEIPIELRRMLPELPIITDPSHIGGKRDMLQKISQRALDLHFDGIMIEVHCDPDQAWSDAAQQIKPDRLKQMLKELVWRKEGSQDPVFRNRLGMLREMIDETDQLMIDLLARRMEIVEEIGHHKKSENISVLQASRWNQIMEDRLKRALEKGLSRDVMAEILQMIHKESIRHQTRILDKDINPVTAHENGKAERS